MKKLLKLLKWIDSRLLSFLIVGFIFLIPLYPKLPLKTINFTYVAIRLEDLYVALISILYGVQLLRKKITINKQFFILALCFWGAVFLSFLWGTFIGKTLPYHELAFLHASRRIQYMAIFFIALSTVRSEKQFSGFLSLILLVMAVVSLYAIGQKFFGLPAVQTMNPEFSKGHILYLTPEARVSSTFAGHYDLAAYLVFLLPIAYSFFFYQSRFRYIVLYVISLFILVLTASRISFIAFIAVTPLFFLFIRKPKHLIFVILTTALFMYLSNSMIARIAKTFQVKQLFVNEKTGQIVVPERITTKELPAGTFYFQIQKEVSQKNTDANAEIVQQKLIEEIRGDASKSGRFISASDAAILASSMSANLRPVNTVVSDISFATRLQIEWPRAIKAFLSNPVLGTGASSITEATDNDYLRMIGEFGLAGLITFGSIIGMILYTTWKKILITKSSQRYVLCGFLFGTLGLLLNAAYIDVFEASKVAYTFWLIAGIFMGYIINNPKLKKNSIK